ncbi:MAG: tellurite resistance TerB family protein [Hyphomicrobiaceae bacterium]|nr:tellurite resistance TerB family protein [Hyphomicrobiaceae bacterium]MCC0007259.1 tellurite resistance TerB family protein [Hyphomicrobiaceae bacterium]
MFDAKSLLEALVTGGAQRQGTPAGGGLGDLLGGLLEGQSGSRPAASGRSDQAGGGLEDLLRNMLPSGGGSAGAGAGSSAGPGGFGGLGDILGKLQEQMGGNAGTGSAGGHPSGGGITDILGEIFGQATSGAKEGASRIGEATGAREALEKMTGGKSADDLLAQLKDLISNNQLGAGAALGGLGALVLGTRTGRSLATTAAKVGALALIGGLAYRAYQNYANGQAPTIDRNFVPEAAPSGSGFEPASVTNGQATLYIRAMIGAAAADGRIDANEQQKILGSLGQVGLDRGAEEFLAAELNNPISAVSLAQAVGSEQEAVQVYTAARIAIDPDTRGEQAFLQELAQRLGMPDALKTHIDAAAVSAAA